MRLSIEEKLTLHTAFIWAVAFKHERNGGVVDCFRRVRRTVQSGWVLAQTLLPAAEGAAL